MMNFLDIQKPQTAYETFICIAMFHVQLICPPALDFYLFEKLFGVVEFQILVNTPSVPQ